MQVGGLAAATSAAIAWWAADVNWFFLVFVLSGIANAALWTTSLTLTLEFGSGAERPAYIGLANTLVAPSTILAPLLGGVLADAAGYPTAFLSSVAGGLLTIAILYFLVRDPRTRTHREWGRADISPPEGRPETLASHTCPRQVPRGASAGVTLGDSPDT
jgi:MFS family permease